MFWMTCVILVNAIITKEKMDSFLANGEAEEYEDQNSRHNAIFNKER